MEPAVLALFAVALVVFGVVSRRMERGVVSPPMVFVGLGFALGQLGWLDSGSELLYGLTELTLVLVLFTDARASTSRTSGCRGVCRPASSESAYP